MVIYRNTHLSFMSKNKKRIADQRGNESKPRPKSGYFIRGVYLKLKSPSYTRAF